MLRYSQSADSPVRNDKLDMKLFLVDIIKNARSFVMI